MIKISRWQPYKEAKPTLTAQAREYIPTGRQPYKPYKTKAPAVIQLEDDPTLGWQPYEEDPPIKAKPYKEIPPQKKYPPLPSSLKTMHPKETAKKMLQLRTDVASDILGTMLLRLGPRGLEYAIEVLNNMSEWGPQSVAHAIKILNGAFGTPSDPVDDTRNRTELLRGLLSHWRSDARPINPILLSRFISEDLPVQAEIISSTLLHPSLYLLSNLPVLEATRLLSYVSTERAAFLLNYMDPTLAAQIIPNINPNIVHMILQGLDIPRLIQILRILEGIHGSGYVEDFIRRIPYPRSDIIRKRFLAR